MRDTATGRWYEEIIDRVLRECGLTYKRQRDIGEKPGGKRHKIDYLSWRPEDPSRKALISCKVQNVGGTAEEKLPYEIIKLLHAMDNDGECVVAYLILGGTGWTQEYIAWLRGDLLRYVPDCSRVRILTTDELISRRIAIP